MHGAEFEDEGVTNQDNAVTSKNNPLPLFQDPKEFEHLSEGEKKELTQQMLSKYQNWSSSAINKKGSF
jgi:hypothetical protein